MKKNTIILLTASMLGLAVANGASISWSFSEIVNTPNPGVQDNLGTGFLQNDGTLFYAENVGGGALTFDSINFGSGTLNFGNNTFHFSHDGTGKNPLSHTATWDSDGSGLNEETVTLGNGGLGADLSNGTLYRVQLIIMDGRGTSAPGSFLVDGNATDHALGINGVTWGNALLATGTFTADATSQDFTLQGVSGGTAVTQLNAIAVHVVPEPSSILLISSALLPFYFLIRRRK